MMTRAQFFIRTTHQTTPGVTQHPEQQIHLLGPPQIYNALSTATRAGDGQGKRR